MKGKKGKEQKFVVCLKNKGYKASLELRKIYQVLPDADADSMGQLRIIDESGDDYLYPANWFAAIELPQSLEKALLKAS
jgi:hypothetical protein